MTNPQWLQAIGAFVAACAALYGTVTVPLLRAIKAEIGLVKAEIKLEMAEMETRLKTEMAGLRTDMAGMKTDMVGMEARLNERIDTRLVHR